MHLNDLVSAFTGLIKGHFLVHDVWNLVLYNAAPDSFLNAFCRWSNCNLGDFCGCGSSSLSESLPLTVAFSAIPGAAILPLQFAVDL